MHPVVAALALAFLVLDDKLAEFDLSGACGGGYGAFTEFSNDGTGSASVIFDPMGKNPGRIKVR